MADDLRTSDAERDRVAGELREHAAQGRLSVDELAERLERVYTTRTRGELGPLTADLPSTRRREAARADLRGHARWFLLVNLLLIAIWAASGAGYFWPIWPLLGWGIGLGSHAFGCRRFPSRV
jgi:hypothetical protein